jgi:hypothetical protein
MPRPVRFALVPALLLALCVPVVATAHDHGGAEAAAAATAAKTAAAVGAAESWLALTDAGKYAESHKAAASLFQGAVTPDAWASAMTASRKPLGALVSREVLTSSYATALPGAPDGEYVVIQFQTSFANKASAVETVTPMVDKDGKWHVSGYFIK